MLPPRTLDKSVNAVILSDSEGSKNIEGKKPRSGARAQDEKGIVNRLRAHLSCSIDGGV